MWRWFRTAIGRPSNVPASDASLSEQRFDNSQREAAEKRVQLAVAEANSRADDRLNRHAEAIDARVADATSRAERLLQDLGEATERRVQLALNQAIAYAEERCGAIQRDLRDQRQHLPAFLNAAATVPALAFELSSYKAALEAARTDLAAISRNVDELRERGESRALHDKSERVAELERVQKALAEAQTDRANLWKSAEGATRGIGDLWQRLEFVRKEIMYEMRFGSESGSKQPETRRPNKIVAEEKVEVARSSGDIRLNLGCGHIPVPGFLNVDFRELPGVDIVADIGALPFDPGSVSEITSFHVLEHFPQEQLRRLLPYWRSLLRPRGTFRAVVPDGEAMLAHQAAGTYSFEDFRMVLFGAQEYEGDFHFNMFTPDYLAKSLTEAGFGKITYPVKGRKNDICYEFEVTAINP